VFRTTDHQNPVLFGQIFDLNQAFAADPKSESAERERYDYNQQLSTKANCEDR